MSWQKFKDNIQKVANDPGSILDTDTVAKLYADEYDACMKRGGDITNRVAIAQGNVEAMRKFFKAALDKGLTSKQPYDLVGEMGNGVIAYWSGAIMNNFPTPIQPALGAIANVSTIDNKIINPGTWMPPVPGTPAPPTPPLPPKEPTEEVLKKIPDDNNTP